MDVYLNRVEVASLESCLTSKESRAVRRGAVGKGRRELHLAGRLPYRLHGSMSGVWRRGMVEMMGHPQTKGRATRGKQTST